MHANPTVQREYILKWKENVEQLILRFNKIDAIKYLRTQEVDANNTIIKYLQIRNINLMNVCKIAQEEKDNRDIRTFITLWRYLGI